LTNATAGRLAHQLDLFGASFVVDAASASSLVALDLAAQALIDRRADLGIAGGVYLEADVDFPLVFRQLNALSRTGSSRPFAAGADGMLPGEGVGVVVLKRRADAERDGDRIYAVIKGIGIASDGKSRGLAAPSARGHARALRRAYCRAGIDPATVMLVEGHGLGVPAADRAELRAISAVFPQPPHGRRALGAVSSMIGHAMPAAGMAGLIKTALALHHRVLPPTLHAEKPHPLLEQPESPFALNPTARPWIHADEEVPRRAGVNAFGFAGINAHAVLEEHARSADGNQPGALRHWDAEAILFSAPDRRLLIDQLSELLRQLNRNSGHSLLDVAYSLNSLREHPPGNARLGLVASSSNELADRLNEVLSRLTEPACRSIHDGRGVYYWDEPLLRGNAEGLAFLFPGEGSQYPGMLADLCFHFPEVRILFDTADRIARSLGETVPPSEHLFSHVPDGVEKLWATTTAVNVVLNAQWALFQVLTRLGLRPSAVLGHSSGELLALAAAGVFETDRALELKLGRLGALMRGFESAGDLPRARLVAVAAHRDRVEALCRELCAGGVAVAMDNCPHQVVVAMPETEHERVIERLRQENILWEELPFSRAYHTPDFSPVVGPIAEFFDQMSFRAPSVPIYSCAARGRMPSAPEAIRELAVAQWTRTVAFRETIEAMHADGLRLFVDVGARGNLAGFVADTLRGRRSFAVAANLPRRTGLTQLNHLVAATFAQGANLKTDYLYARRRPRAIGWNAPAPAPRTSIELKIGFPVMRPSADLVRRFRSSAVRQSPTEPPDSEPIAGDRWRALSDRGAPVDWNGNGVVHNDLLPAAATACLTSAATATSAQSEPASLYCNGRGEEPEAGPRSSAPSEVDDAMLAFQDTMQAFLRTQQEVITAYLHGLSADRVHASDLAEEHTASRDTQSQVGVDRESEPLREGEAPPEPMPIGWFPREGEAPPGPMPVGRAFREGEAPSEPPLIGWLSREEPGAWAGEVRRLVPGVEVETLLVLESHDDPIAKHHTLGGRKVSALDPSLLGLPVVPFAVMAEMTAQVAGLIARAGLVLTGLKQVCAHKWVRYEEQPVYLELRGQRISSSDDERVWVGIFNRGTNGLADAPRPVFEAIAVFAENLPAPPPAPEWSLENSRPSKFTAQSVYAEQWLFHGPIFQAIARMGSLSGRGIEGTLRVLPLEPLVKEGQPTTFHTDLIVIDNFTQLLGAWGLDYLSEGDVMFPLRLEELEIHGDRPAIGALVDCRITILEMERHRVRVEAQFVRADGTVWMRIKDWEDWRFHWPGRYRDAFRQPRDYMVGEELALDDPVHGRVAGAKAVWLEPPADMGRPVWRDVLEQVQLGPEERACYLASLGMGSEQLRSRRLWGRMAAKEAARRLWNDTRDSATYPADLAVVADERGRPLLRRVGRADLDSLPSISIAHTDGVAVGLAALDPAARVGIDVEAIVERPAGFEALAFTATERTLLERWAGSNRTEWTTRFWCAKEAAAKASGLGMKGGPASAQVVEADENSGVLHVLLSPELLSVMPGDVVNNPVRVVSALRGNRAWAWTIIKGVAP
jgi:acyl transferase domain-containing protein/phosphopantetheinyl transferase (holo-ACP synthase)